MDNALKQLAMDVVLGKPIANFSTEQAKIALVSEFNKLVTDKNGKVTQRSWEEGKFELFELVAEVIDELVPTQVDPALLAVAEVKHYNDGDKPRFTINTANLEHLKRFVTRVTQAGKYNRTRLDNNYVDVEIYAHGGAVYQSWSDVLAGRGDIGQLFQAILVALELKIYEDVADALVGIQKDIPALYKHEGAFDLGKLVEIGLELKKYGTPTIYCSELFAYKNLKSAADEMSEEEKLELRNQGYVGKIKGMPVVALPASSDFTDKGCFIIPAGVNDKPIKIAYEGNTQMRDIQRESWELEIQFYKKVGVAVVTAGNLMGYVGEAL